MLQRFFIIRPKKKKNLLPENNILVMPVANNHSSEARRPTCIHIRN